MFKRFIAASRTELITLAGAIVTIIVALWKTFSEPIANCSGNFKCLANYLLDNLTFFNVTVFLVASICAIAILILNFQRLIESMRKERDEPVGSFSTKYLRQERPRSNTASSRCGEWRTAGLNTEALDVQRSLLL